MKTFLIGVLFLLISAPCFAQERLLSLSEMKVMLNTDESCTTLIRPLYLKALETCISYSEAKMRRLDLKLSQEDRDDLERICKIKEE